MSRERDRVEGIRRMKIREQKKNCLADFRNCHLILLIVVVRPKKNNKKQTKSANFMNYLYTRFVCLLCFFVEVIEQSNYISDGRNLRERERGWMKSKN